uniref:Uncharacterized protein n=1 Tax=Amphimedon queenslandica TaxID=400682 RepID=A0A1X7UYI9_AMPQE
MKELVVCYQEYMDNCIVHQHNWMLLMMQQKSRHVDEGIHV